MNKLFILTQTVEDGTPFVIATGTEEYIKDGYEKLKNRINGLKIKVVDNQEYLDSKKDINKLIQLLMGDENNYDNQLWF